MFDRNIRNNLTVQKKKKKKKKTEKTSFGSFKNVINKI